MLPIGKSSGSAAAGRGVLIGGKSVELAGGLAGAAGSGIIGEAVGKLSAEAEGDGLAGKAGGKLSVIEGVGDDPLVESAVGVSDEIGETGAVTESGVAGGATGAVASVDSGIGAGETAGKSVGDVGDVVGVDHEFVVLPDRSVGKGLLIGALELTELSE